MAKNGQIQNVTIVGTGVIAASWAAYYLSRGLNVIATDPAPNAVDDATPPGAILASRWMLFSPRASVLSAV